MKKISNKIYQGGISIKPNYSVEFVTCIAGGYSKSLQPIENRSKGIFSNKSQTRLKDAINWMVFLSEGKEYYSRKTKKYHKLQLNLITLTLCSKQKHSDQYIQRHMLQPFLKWMIRKGNSLYVWRAETQENGNIHFHITSNKYLEWKSITLKWNHLLQSHGYMKDYLNKHRNQSPNSCDVRGVKKFQKVAAYLSDYMAKKSEGRRLVECKMWGCSEILSQIKITLREGDKHTMAAFTLIKQHSRAEKREFCTVNFHDDSKQLKEMIKYFVNQLMKNNPSYEMHR